MAEPPPQAVLGLLNYVTATSLDEDYAHVSARRDASGGTPRTRQAGRGGLAVLAAFGLLVATAAVQTARNAGESANSHSSLVAQVNDHKRALSRQQSLIAELRRQNLTLEARYLDASSEGRSVSDRLNRLGTLTGARPVTGRGIKVTVDDAGHEQGQEVLDRDLQKLVNGLWAVGAEAIAINGQRVTNLTAIREAGEGITVNFRHVNSPYVVSAIGNADTMGARFLDTSGGQTWLALHSTVGLGFEITIEQSLRLPAASRLTLRNAHRPDRSTS